MRKLTVAALAILVVATGSSATAEHKPIKRADPRKDAYIDVWRTTKVKSHRRPYLVSFKVYGSLGPDRTVSVFVDSRGGPRAEFELWSFESLGNTGCGGERLFGDAIDVRCGFRRIECCYVGQLWWTVSRARLHATKVIRWRIHTHYPGATDDSQDDLAPDSGWYP